MIGAKGCCVSAAFIMEGVHQVGYQACIDAYGNGCIEMVQEMVGYANLADAMYTVAAQRLDAGFPGMYDYEVSAVFGTWLAHTLISEGGMPGRDRAKAKLVELADQFFAQAKVEAP